VKKTEFVKNLVKKDQFIVVSLIDFEN